MRVKVCRKAGCNNTLPYAQANPYCSEHAELHRRLDWIDEWEDAKAELENRLDY